MIEQTSNFLSLPLEILEYIISFVDARDIQALTHVSRELRRLCLSRRHRLPQHRITLISCQFGEWHDVLKVKKSSKSLVKYTLSDAYPFPNYYFSKTNFSLSLFLKKLLRSPSIKVPYSAVIQNCCFNTMMVEVQMLSPDLDKLLHFGIINAYHIVLNMSHPSLYARNLSRYLPQICRMISTNKHIQMLTFIFLSETSDYVIERVKSGEHQSCFGAFKCLSASIQQNTRIFTVTTPLNHVSEFRNSFSTVVLKHLVT